MASLLQRTARTMAPRLLSHRTPPLTRGFSRNMVMVTKTSVSHVPEPVKSTGASPPTSTRNSIESDLLNVTESCMNRVKSLAEKRNDSLDEVYLRVYVDAGGCSGFQYKFEMTKDAEEAIDSDDDKVFSSPDGARVVVDSASLELIEGSTVDFIQEMIKSAFAVTNNPKSESACGCGSSFAIKNFESNPALD